MRFRDVTYEISPPLLEIQREIVARIEAKRQIVEGNRELIRLYEAKVKQVIEKVGGVMRVYMERAFVIYYSIYGGNYV